MAAWFTIYCTRSVWDLTAVDVSAALGAVDFYTEAEHFGIEDEAVVKRAVSALRVEPVTGRIGERFHVSYWPAEYRPLVVYLWSDAAQVQEELAETEENYLAGRGGRGVSRVRSVLKDVIEVAAIELGWGQLEDMGLVIASRLSTHLAGVGGGLIRDTGDEWWAVRAGVARWLCGSGQDA